MKFPWYFKFSSVIITFARLITYSWLWCAVCVSPLIILFVSKPHILTHEQTSQFSYLPTYVYQALSVHYGQRSHGHHFTTLHSWSCFVVYVYSLLFVVVVVVHLFELLTLIRSVTGHLPGSRLAFSLPGIQLTTAAASAQLSLLLPARRASPASK